MTFEDLETLRWFTTKAGHGRGRVEHIKRRLLDAGYLKLSWIGPREWVIEITEKGRAVLTITETGGI